MLLPILEVGGIFEFICKDFCNFLNPNKEQATYLATSLDVKA